MKKSLQRFFTCLFLLIASIGYSFAQGTISGKVIDGVTKEGLPGAPVSVKGTSIGTTTDLDGNFTIKLTTASAVLEINYIGYNKKEVQVTATKDKNIGSIPLEATTTSISEIVVTSSSTAIDRKTPVAVSTINSTFIEEKGSSQEFPELLKSTPGIYATKASGGYGDSRVNIRGFQAQNVAVMINGIPINDMEYGTVYWNDWAGLADVTRSMQVQRGLGASKVAVPSVGGTINILTRTTDAVQGGFVSQMIGNNNLSKTAFSYASGLNDKGWAFSLLGSRSTGSLYFDGSNLLGYAYFGNISKKINSHHTLSLTGFGANQSHGQRYTYLKVSDFRNAPQGNKLNLDYGYLDGQFLSDRENFYNKPQIALNHYWTINDKSFLSSAIYYSYGNGGATYGNNMTAINSMRTGGTYSPIDFNKIRDVNLATDDGNAVYFLQTSANVHQWYGAISTYQSKLTDHIDLMAGLDYRNYIGSHYKTVNNLLGASYVLDNNNANNPNYFATTGDKILNDYDRTIGWEGAFLQAEYNKDKLATFLSFSASNTSYQQNNRFKATDQKSARANKFGYQVKGGANYNVTEHSNFFANLGYFEKAPLVGAVFISSSSNVFNPKAVDEKIASFELGYGYRSTKFNANLNVYSTSWKDKSSAFSIFDKTTNLTNYVNITGINARHQGIELDFKYRPVSTFTFSGSVSLENNVWTNNPTDATVTDQNGQLLGAQPVGPYYMKDVKVGDAPQTLVALGADWNVFKNLKLGANVNYYGDYSSNFDPTALTTAGLVPYTVPNYTLVDVNAVFKFKIAGLESSLFANINNLLNTVYISDGYANFTKDPSSGMTYSDARNSNVWYGFGTTWTTGLKVKF